MIILSICIPTYNRVEYLAVTVNSIVNQNRFSENKDVEIVISDNGSTDGTDLYCSKLVQSWDSRIKYYNLKKPQGFVKNIFNVLSNANGQYLKLNNDTLIHHQNSLIEIINEINNAKIVLPKMNLFFSNNDQKIGGEYKNFDYFMNNFSYSTTWIGSYGFWKDDLSNLNEIKNNINSYFPHLELFEYINSNQSIKVNNLNLFTSVHPVGKGGYNLYEVFIQQYHIILKRWRSKNFITSVTYKKIKRDTLLNVAYWHTRTIVDSKNVRFSTYNWEKFLNEGYNEKYYKILFIIYFTYFFVINLLIKLKNLIK